jgi:hypothetical protein
VASSDGPPPDDVDGLVERYEQLRAQAIGDTVGGPRLGVGLLVGEGMVAWIKVAGACPAATSSPSPPPASASSPPAGAAAAEVVRVLAAMVMGAITAGG